MFLTLVTACGGQPPAGDQQPPSRTGATTDATDATDATEEPSPSTTAEPRERGTRIVASGSEFGRMLFDSTGQGIYLFDVETDSLLGTTERTDGTLQVTYGGHPLYFYAHEGKREAKCHDVFLNGGTWYVVRPSGEAAPPG